MRLELPASLVSMAGVDLDVAASTLRLSTPAPDASVTVVDLGRAVDSDSAKAKFSKKRGTLTVTCAIAE